MAKRSKTQRAKASAARQAKKAEKEMAEEISDVQGTDADAKKSSDSSGADSKGGILKKSKESSDADSKSVKSSKEEKAPKKKRFQFLRDVRSELKRVTWPTKVDVLRWSGVVVAALVFFGVFVAILDNLIVTPLLVLLSGADPSSIDWFNVLTGSDNSFVDSSSASDVGDISVDTTGSDAGTDAGVDAGTDAGTDGGDTATDTEAQQDEGSEE